MVLVPGGPFEMGSNNGNPDERPVHPVTLAAFYVDQHEVTNAQYRRCEEAGDCDTPGCLRPYEALDKADHPVVCVSWFQAKAYCEWRDARLPTEAEWEKAARGDDGPTYPWGEIITCQVANYGGTLKDNGCVGATSRVRAYPTGVSPYGVYDMGGNVWEWTADWYDSSYYGISPTENPLGPNKGSFKVMRGGSWHRYERHVRATYRNYYGPDSLEGDIGFRCVSAVP
jgi:formylglycine-generating enzyme required for sulfatase activity